MAPAGAPSSKPTASPSPADGPSEEILGPWSKVPPAPFGAQYPIAAWTGDSLLVVDQRTGRTATWDGSSEGGWNERARAPFSNLAFDKRAALADGRLMVLGTDEDGDPVAIAYDVAADGWTSLASPPIGPAVAVVWTGDRLVAATDAGASASYNPDRDCWSLLPAGPGAGSVVDLLWTGESVLADTRTPIEAAAARREVAVALLDPLSLTWTAGTPAPFPIGHGQRAVWADGAVHYWTWTTHEPTGDAPGLDEGFNARYDQADDVWARVETACQTFAQSTVTAGDLLIATDGELAFDPQSGTCVDLPSPPELLAGRGATVWTGDALISWSGTRDEAGKPIRGGLVLQLQLPETRAGEE